MNIQNREVGSFFRDLDLNSYILIASCVSFGTWFNAHYPDPTVFKNMDAEETETYFDNVAKGLLAGGFSIVKILQDKVTSEAGGTVTAARRVG